MTGPDAAAEALDFADRLAGATEAFDRRRATDLCRSLIPTLLRAEDPYPEAAAVRVLGILRRKRWFTLMIEVGDALLQSGQRAPTVRRQYAQALIDQGMLAGAEAVLGALLADVDDQDERAEALGLLGRTYKQMGVAPAARDTARSHLLLQRAVACYSQAYEMDRDRYGWQGINAAALLVLAQRRGTAIEGTRPAEDIAAAILRSSEQRWLDQGAMSVWDYALAGEACLVLGRDSNAIGWFERYVADPRVDSFELSATLRQLVEVWGLDSTAEPGSYLVPVLQGGILGREDGGSLDISATDVRSAAMPAAAGLEKVLGHEGMMTYTWYRQGLARSRAVAAITDRVGEPVGTGFLVDGGELHPMLAARGEVLVTNNHVIAAGGGDGGALDPSEALVRFQVLTEERGEDVVFEIADLVWSSPPHRLDAAIVVLDRPMPAPASCPVTSVCPRIDGKQRVYVIGHPQGRALSYSIADNVLIDRDDRVLHYRAPTEPGSSGSPVFNRAWQVIAIHHSGRQDMPRLKDQAGTYPANEGIWIEAIRSALEAELAGPQPPPGG